MVGVTPNYGIFVIPSPSSCPMEHVSFHAEDACQHTSTSNTLQMHGSWEDLSEKSARLLSDDFACHPEREPPLTPSTSAGSDDVSVASLAESAQVHQQISSRAVKRQRARERRKFHKALARLEQQNDKTTLIESDVARPMVAFDSRVAAAVAELRLVTKNTFVDVVGHESQNVDFAHDILLPPPYFQTAGDMEQWRRDYRKQRLGCKHAECTIDHGILDVERIMPWLVL